MHKIIIAIDGHSSCGKSTLARSLAQRLGYTYIDSGAMYRAVTLYLLRHGISAAERERIDAVLPKLQLSFNDKNEMLLNGENVEHEIRQMKVSNYVSEVAAVPEVRRAMVEQQQEMGRQRGIVMDGRDIGTVVFPDAELKIFLTASSQTRAQRRHEELRQKGYPSTIAEVEKNLAHRDHIDSTREDSPLKQAADAIIIDNTRLSREAQLARALELAHQAGATGSS
ncbi:MAG: (d)CMP kinase [Bacteroidetes bacterium]|nr:(d)CMP kinase [Bacteroidota bacterium]